MTTTIGTFLAVALLFVNWMVAYVTFLMTMGVVVGMILEDEALKMPLVPSRHDFLEVPFLDFGQRPGMLCVVDFECTCDEPNVGYHEIIEFPIVTVDLTTGFFGPTFHSFGQRRVFSKL